VFRVDAARAAALKLIHRLATTWYRARLHGDRVAAADAGTSMRDALTAWGTAQGHPADALCPTSGVLLPAVRRG